MAGIYDRFTDRARKVMQLANQEAQRFNHEYIGTEHILLGLVSKASGAAANVLKNLEIDRTMVRSHVERIIMPVPGMVTDGRLPQTPRMKKVIEYAIEEARTLNHNHVGTEHLLLGLLREQEGVAAQVLMDLGLRLEEVRQEVLNLLGGCATPTKQELTPLDEISTETEELFYPDDVCSFVQEVDEQIEQLNNEKELAIAEQDFERAATARDQVDRLKKQRERFRREWHGRHAITASCLSWNDGAVVKMARVIRAERRWDDFPILADALEEAGCTDADILSHCRQSGAHSRRCWVLDLLLDNGSV